MKKIVVSALVGIVVIGSSGCSVLDNEDMDDVYPILCPAIQAASNGDKLQKKIVRKLVDEAQEHTKDKDTKKFLKYAKMFASEDDNKVTKQAKKSVKKTCSAHGSKIKL